MDSNTHLMIENFVRGPLGCDCPDKVFQHIEVTDNPADFKTVLGGKLYPSSLLITIGGILLVLTVEAESWELIQSRLEAVFKRGIEVRDNRGYNRFRLVVATTNREDIHRALTQQFKKLVGDDEKIHLHVLSLEQLPNYKSS